MATVTPQVDVSATDVLDDTAAFPAPRMCIPRGLGPGQEEGEAPAVTGHDGDSETQRLVRVVFRRFVRERETLCCEGSACSLERGERVVIMGGDNTVFLSGIALLFVVMIFRSFLILER